MLIMHGLLIVHQEILEIHIRHYEPPKCIVDGHLRYELVIISVVTLITQINVDGLTLPPPFVRRVLTSAFLPII